MQISEPNAEVGVEYEFSSCCFINGFGGLRGLVNGLHVQILGLVSGCGENRIDFNHCDFEVFAHFKFDACIAHGIGSIVCFFFLFCSVCAYCPFVVLSICVLCSFYKTRNVF